MQLKANPSCCPLRPRTTPFPEEKSILGVTYGVLLWAVMNAATPLGAWGRSAMSLAARALQRMATYVTALGFTLRDPLSLGFNS